MRTSNGFHADFATRRFTGSICYLRADDNEERVYAVHTILLKEHTTILEEHKEAELADPRNKKYLFGAEETLLAVFVNWLYTGHMPYCSPHHERHIINYMDEGFVVLVKLYHFAGRYSDRFRDLLADSLLQRARAFDKTGKANTRLPDHRAIEVLFDEDGDCPLTVGHSGPIAHLLIEIYISSVGLDEMEAEAGSLNRGFLEGVAWELMRQRGRPRMTLEQLRSCDYHAHTYEEDVSSDRADHAKKGLLFEESDDPDL